MRITRSLLLLSLGLAGCAPPRPAPDAIAPATTRGSNADLEADLAVMDAWEARRAVLVRDDALKGLGSPRASELANAGAWLAFARDAMAAHRRSTAADEAFAEARRIIENAEHETNKPVLAAAPRAAATLTASAAPQAPPPRSSAAESSYPALWSRTRALESSPITRNLVAQVEVELARAAAGNERDSAAVSTQLASAGAELPAGAVPMQRVARTSVAGAPTVSCPLAPHLARAQQLLAEAESRQRQHLAALAADSAARAAAEARLALLASIRDDGRVRTRPVHFALDKDELSAASRALLDKVSAALKEHPGLVVVLEGHTDPRGSFEYNLDLSRRRARAVHRYLEGTGLDVSRIDVKGLGLTARRTTGTTREEYALDRRVMVRFSMEDGTPIAETDELLDVQVEEARREAARRVGGTAARPTTRPPAKAASRTPARKPAMTRTTTPTATTRTTNRTTGGQR